MRQVEIKLSRCLLVLSESELMGQLAKEPGLLEKAIGQGKGLRRAHAAKDRQVKVPARCKETLNYST